MKKTVFRNLSFYEAHCSPVERGSALRFEKITVSIKVLILGKRMNIGGATTAPQK
ncbi:MAG: hypothetical protein PVG99_15420 [Desulfobacteraceae bacterium]|jgi:hypothetical protein